MPEFTPITFQGKIKTHTCFFMNYTNNMVKCRGFALDLRTVSSCMTRNWSARSWRMKELTQNVIRFHWWKLTQNAQRELCSISSIHSIIICDLLWRPMFEFKINKTCACTLHCSFCLVYLYRKGPEWQSIRSPAQQSIKPSVIKLYIPAQNQCAEELVTWLSNYGNNNPDVKEAFMRYSADGKFS